MGFFMVTESVNLDRSKVLLRHTLLFKSKARRAREHTKLIEKGIQSEDDITVEFANTLRALSIERKLKGIWAHVPNEVSDNQNKVFGMNLLAKGKMAGMADFFFIRDGGGMLIEIKAKDGRLSPDQKCIQKWCEEEGVTYFIAKSCQEALDLLKEYGFIKQNKH